MTRCSKNAAQRMERNAWNATQGTKLIARKTIRADQFITSHHPSSVTLAHIIKVIND